MPDNYANLPLTRQEVDAMTGRVLLDFGTNWCGICQGAAPSIQAALEQRPDIRHIKIEDGPGRPLGRSFRVKLWPTLVLMKDGQVEKILVRPGEEEVAAALGKTPG